MLGVSTWSDSFDKIWLVFNPNHPVLFICEIPEFDLLFWPTLLEPLDANLFSKRVILRRMTLLIFRRAFRWSPVASKFLSQKKCTIKCTWPSRFQAFSSFNSEESHLSCSRELAEHIFHKQETQSLSDPCTTLLQLAQSPGLSVRPEKRN